MDTVNLSIDGRQVRVPAGTTILEAAAGIDIYVPRLCYHPDLPPAQGSEAVGVIFQGERKISNASPGKPGQGCMLCVVEVEGTDEPVASCTTAVAESMVVTTDSNPLKAVRQEKLMSILQRHRHACLTCSQQAGCSRTECSSNVPENERCCSQFGRCELQKTADYIGIPDSTPRWMPTDLAVIKDHPLFTRDYNLCIGCTRCVRACRDLRGIEAIGFVYDEKGQVRIGTLAETLADSGCKFCTACVEVCPTGALVDKAVNAGVREQDLVPCQAACPAHIDVPAYLRMIAMGKADEANAIVREKVPFPGVLGRVCIHPCESVCRRGEVNQPISICALKRYAADNEDGFWKSESKAAAASGKKVAVVGAGPAGLTAAFYLRKQGHAVSLFDSSSQPGGMMRYGIPEYRLPRALLDREIKDIMALDVDYKPNQCLGRDFSLDGLAGGGYDAVFLGLGARRSRCIRLEGCIPPDLLLGIDFLRQVAEGRKVRLKDRVVVIGGGSVAVDAALTALRCGATDVKIACLECVDEMSAGPREIAEARAEGVQILSSRGAAEIISEDGRMTGMDLKECTSLFDGRGNFCPEFSDKAECIPVDQVIMAVGQATDLSFLGDTSPIKTEKGLIVVDGDTLETGMKGVYAGGDVARATGSVIHAVAAGRRAAESIDQALGGSGNIDEVLFKRGSPDPHLGRDEGFALSSRAEMSKLNPATRIRGFEEIALGFSHAQAVGEAGRCLQCDLRLQISCNPSPPQTWLPFDEAHIKEVPETEGVVQLLDGDHHVLAIKGAANLRLALSLALEENDKAAYFIFEEDKMYTKRESELLQKYLQQHGEMPGGGDDLDDLF
ncbi:MAG: FAD-dependent oxidoreductase [Desulfobacterales bacterium]